jgi:hypothetical protein
LAAIEKGMNENPFSFDDIIDCEGEITEQQSAVFADEFRRRTGVSSQLLESLLDDEVKAFCSCEAANGEVGINGMKMNLRTSE